MQTKATFICAFLYFETILEGIRRPLPCLPLLTWESIDESNSQTKPAVSLMTIMLSIVARVHRAQLLRLPLQKMAQFIPLKMATTVYKTKGNRCQRVRVESYHSWSLNRGRPSNDHQRGCYTGVAKVPINPCPERIPIGLKALMHYDPNDYSGHSKASEPAR